eukprot:COSAG06_NODE_5412_length_3499_cov_34.315294_2_plen_69_part_00
MGKALKNRCVFLGAMLPASARQTKSLPTALPPLLLLLVLLLLRLLLLLAVPQQQARRYLLRGILHIVL